MKKKLIAVMMAAVMTAALAGCGNKSADESKTDTAQDTKTTQETENVTKEAEPTKAAEEKDAAGEETTILVAAAASLEYSYTDELIPMFEEANPGIKVEGTYDSSGKLQTQIEEGLEADVFMSAAMKQMNALKDESMIDADSVVNWNSIIAMSCVSLLPVVLLFVFLQKYFVQGIATTGMKN